MALGELMLTIGVHLTETGLENAENPENLVLDKEKVEKLAD